MLKTSIKQFVDLVSLAKSIANSSVLTWEEKFKLVFRLKPEIDATGHGVDYYHDPSTTYQADTEAYVNAQSEKAERLESFLKEINNAV